MYSAAGVSHVLALSGLHVGILSCILLWLFYPLTYLKHGRKILAFLVVCLLWLFAFISGLSSSVVRAVVMYSLYTFASFCSEERFSGMHSLVLAAFLMLIYNPFFLFDISFQLSFTAVFSILAFYPKKLCVALCVEHTQSICLGSVRYATFYSVLFRKFSDLFSTGQSDCCYIGRWNTDVDAGCIMCSFRTYGGKYGDDLIGMVYIGFE